MKNFGSFVFTWTRSRGVEKFYIDFFYYRILSSGHDYKGIVWDSEVPILVIIPANIYLFKAVIETLEKGVKFVQN